MAGILNVFWTRNRTFKWYGFLLNVQVLMLRVHWVVIKVATVATSYTFVISLPKWKLLWTSQLIFTFLFIDKPSHLVWKGTSLWKQVRRTSWSLDTSNERNKFSSRRRVFSAEEPMRDKLITVHSLAARSPGHRDKNYKQIGPFTSSLHFRFKSVSKNVVPENLMIFLNLVRTEQVRLRFTP